MFIVSSIRERNGAEPIDSGYFETETIDDVLDAVESALKNGATQIHISIEEYSSEGYGNDYE